MKKFLVLGFGRLGDNDWHIKTIVDGSLNSTHELTGKTFRVKYPHESSHSGSGTLYKHIHNNSF
jgi:hypothetical protein